MTRPLTPNRECAVCGEPFAAAAFDISAGRGNFCSRDCSNKSRTGSKATPENIAKAVAGCAAAVERRRRETGIVKSKRLYNVWRKMRQRCEDPTEQSFARYGGRGIYVCERWKVFDNFCLDMGHPAPGMEIDRIDNDGPYAPGNCRWATRAQQARNRSQNVWVTIDGTTLCLEDWATKAGLSRGCLRWRLQKGIQGAQLIAPSLPRGQRFQTKRESA